MSRVAAAPDVNTTRAAWPTVRLGEVLTPVHGRATSVNGSVEYSLLGAHWYAKGLYVKDRKAGSSIKASTLYRIEEGDFVYNRLFAWKGSFAVATPEHAGCFVSNEFPCFQVDRSRIDPGFLWLYFNQERVWNEAFGLSFGATPTSRNRLKEDRLLAMRVPLPPLSEQCRIAARIDQLAVKVGEARTLRARGFDQSKLMLTNAIDGIIGTDWPIVSLADAVDPERPITYGIVQAGPHTPDGVPYIRVSDMTSASLSLDRMLRTSPDIAARYQRSAVKPGDLVFAIRATVGKVRQVPAELDGANLTQGTARIAPSHTATGQYLFWALQSRRVVDAIRDATKGSTFREITLGRLRSIPVPLPPVAAQSRIVGRISAVASRVDDVVRHLMATSAELDALMPTILDRAFKGEL